MHRWSMIKIRLIRPGKFIFGFMSRLIKLDDFGLLDIMTG